LYLSNCIEYPDETVLAAAYTTFMDRRYVAFYCASGPYRRVRGLVEELHAEWLPWGYRMSAQQAEELSLRAGDVIELWEVDDMRRPASATPLTVASVDYVAVADNYLALTLVPGNRPVLSTEEMVLLQVQSRKFVVPLEFSQANDGERRVERAADARAERSAQSGAEVQSTFAALSMGS
jgi:hypothetical protein